MFFDIVTIFPHFFDSCLENGVIKRAIKTSVISVSIVDLRNFASDNHKTTDDRPFGGGEGMVMKPEPIFKALDVLKKESPKGKVILFSPRGKLLNHTLVKELAQYHRLILICGRYEGIDERIHRYCADFELSIGDYILCGGEIASLVVIESVSRLIPGVLGCTSSAEKDCFGDGLLKFPQYTRPRIFKGLKVPEVLISGDHQKIAQWRREQSLKFTYEQRPELLNQASLDKKDIEYLRRLGWSEKN
jgi:tRNA (guanine37-N1)-methyltransferase